jgi:hypothetical protein
VRSNLVIEQYDLINVNFDFSARGMLFANNLDTLLGQKWSLVVPITAGFQQTSPMTMSNVMVLKHH